MVAAIDSKSIAVRRAGSIPAVGTNGGYNIMMLDIAINFGATVTAIIFQADRAGSRKRKGY